VETGILDVASRLFHVTFKPVPDAVVWDPSVSTFDVFDGDKQLGCIYLDKSRHASPPGQGSVV
jgi:thimet oligopeptidase